MNTSDKPADAAPMVYVVDQQPFDYNPATQFGTLYFLKPAKLAPTAPNDNNTYNDSIVRQIKRELSAYEPGRDYIIPTGQPSKMLLVGMILASLGTRHRLLGWDARAQRYMEYIVDI